ncbi:glycosyltransferase family 4 protein [Pusillimonas minor]|uniref:Glycosyltransferase family 4 protein n=1 Tax=Pusillimonas minor TaxID=2697024 RepID=A0A842HQQ3_9BURK|nr:glycosyltransferase family 1 protein [Pusillimonas minor]MBC2770603.1 glycosyltransferase family 4 protein [Pusillimonas minor]
MKGKVLKVYFDGQIFIEQVVGGISRYYASLAEALNNTPGVQARIIAPFHRNEHLDKLKGKAEIGMRFPPHWRVGRISWVMLRASSPAIARFGRPDIVHETYYADRPYLTHARKRVATVYDMIHELYFPGSETAERKKRTLARCDHVMCISHNTQKDLCEMYGFPIERTSVTHLSYKDFGAYADVEPPPSLRGAPYFLFVGNRSGYKNFSLLLEAFASDFRLRSDFRIVTIGGGAFSTEELALCARLNLASTQVVQVSGGDDVLGSAYAHATAFVYPSLYEGFGIPPLEAMSVDCPVLSSNTSSLPEVVGDAALLFDPRDVEALRAAMLRVADSEVLRSELSERGKRRCLEFTWQRCASSTLAAYRLIL